MSPAADTSANTRAGETRVRRRSRGSVVGEAVRPGTHVPPRADPSFDAVCSVTDLIDTPITVLDLDGRILHLNPAYERLIGRTAAELRGHPVHEVLPAEGRLRRSQFARGAVLFRSLLARGAGRAVFPNQGPDGELVQVEVVAELFRRENRESSFVLARVNDLGGAIEQLDARIAALRQLASAGDDLLLEIVRAARRLIGTRYAAIHVLDHGRLLGVVQDGMSVAEVEAIGRIPDGSGLFSAMEHAKGPMRIRDVQADPRAEGVPSGHPPIKALLAVPMVAGVERYGNIYFGDKLDLDEFTVLDERLAEVFAIHGAIAIRDARQQAARTATVERLVLSERQLAAAQRIGGVGSWERDLATDTLTWSTEASRLLGVEPDEMPRTLVQFLAFVHPEDRTRTARNVEEMVSGDPAPIDYRIVRADGAERVVHEVSEVIRDEQGVPRKHIGATEDITERVAAEGERARMASAVAQTSDGVFIFDPDTKVVYANSAASRMYGYSADDLVGRELTIIDSGLQPPEFFVAVYAGARAGQPWMGAIVNRHRDGTLVHAEVSITPMFDAGGGLTGIIESHRDVTERLSAERERERLVSAIEQAPNPIWILEPDGTITYVNAAVTRLYGYTPAELVGQDPSILNSGIEPQSFWEEMWAQVLAGRGWSGTITNRMKGGSLVQIDSTVSPVVAGDGRVTAIIAADRDVTRERALESDLERQARERDSIEEALRGIDPTASPEEIATIACAEISRLGDIGSAVVFDLTPGAETVLGLAGRMSPEIRAGAPIREEFAETLRQRGTAGPWIHDLRTDPLASEARDGARSTGLQTMAYAPFKSPYGTFGVIGIGGHDSQAADRLVERLSALAMFGSIFGAMLGPSLDARHRGSEAQAMVRANLEASAFTPHFQPIVRLTGGAVMGYEALTRFLGQQDPALAFAAAARAGLGINLELATLIGALKAAASLPAEVFLSVNASPALIDSGELLRILSGESRRIVLEITEHVPITDYPAVRRSIEKLGPNVKLAVDDAGAGFASFRHILELAPDFVKLDIALVRGIDTDPARQALAAGMVFFAAERGLRLIAEGVETRAERNTLRGLGVELGQGYLLGRPRAAPATPG